MCGDSPKTWFQWLPLAEYWYNTNFHTAINTTPFEVVYGQPPTHHLHYTNGDSSVEVVYRTLVAREQAVALLKFHLQRTQDRMTNQANKHRTERQLVVGNWVYLKLQPYRQLTIRKGAQHKLSSKFCGPF